jgi:hemoglobin
MMRIAARSFSVGLFVLLLAATHPAAAQQKSLYQRLGGYDAIAAVTDEFIARFVAHPSLGRFFAGHSDDSKSRLRGHVVDFLCKATGGPCAYNGRTMKVSHQGLSITETDWERTVAVLVGALDKFKVPAAEKNEVLAAVAALKPDIVQASAKR